MHDLYCCELYGSKAITVRLFYKILLVDKTHNFYFIVQQRLSKLYCSNPIGVNSATKKLLIIDIFEMLARINYYTLIY